jgi:transposase-like protein
MPAPPDPRRSEAFDLFEQSVNVSEVARRFGIPRSTAQSWRGAWLLAKKAPAEPSKEDVKDMEIAALRSKLKIAEGTAKVTPAYTPPPSSSPEARWKAAELDNAEHIKRALLMAQFSVELPDEPVAVTFVSDQHISLGNTVDLQRMRADAEAIASQDGVFAILGGDATDNHIKHRSAVLAARSQPSEQFELFEFYLSIFAHRILVAISGNHDLWTNQLAGVDVLSMLLAKQRVCYAPDEALLNISLGSQQYKVAMRHQYRMNSSFNETHCVKQFYRNGTENWDIGCIGHHHVGACEYFYGHGEEKIALRPGSYQITSAYSRQYGFNSTVPTCPTVVIYPDRKEMVAFHRLEPALRFLKGERGS